MSEARIERINSYANLEGAISGIRALKELGLEEWVLTPLSDIDQQSENSLPYSLTYWATGGVVG